MWYVGDVVRSVSELSDQCCGRGRPTYQVEAAFTPRQVPSSAGLLSHTLPIDRHHMIEHNAEHSSNPKAVGQVGEGGV